MLRKTLAVAVAIALIAVVSVRAEPIRTLLCKENKTPELHKFEAGVVGSYAETPEEFNPNMMGYDTYEFAPYVRFGAARNLTLTAELPYDYIDRQIGDTESGIGDFALGVELVAYQDIMDYPYVLPHARVSFATGDEDKGLGTGQTLVTLGTAVGTTVDEIFHWVADARYTIHEEGENIASLSGAFIWDLSDQCSIHVEGRGTDEERGQGREHPMLFLGGLTYKATESLTIIGYGGGGKNTEEDVLAALKVAYSF